MLTFFPELLFLSPFAPVLIRIALGLLLLYEGRNLFSLGDTRHRIAGIASFVVAALFLAGAWTQLVALLLALAYVVFLIRPFPDASFSSLPRSTLALAVAMALTLVITGAGLFALDLPL